RRDPPGRDQFQPDLPECRGDPVGQLFRRCDQSRWTCANRRSGAKDFCASHIAVEGTDVLLTVIVSGTETLSYQWRSNNVDIAGARTNTLLLPNIAASAAASYSVFVTN